MRHLLIPEIGAHACGARVKAKFSAVDLDIEAETKNDPDPLKGEWCCEIDRKKVSCPKCLAKTPEQLQAIIRRKLRQVQEEE